MKNSELKKLHRNNKGMSLVELIVAVAILFVAITPLLYAFVYTANFNAKAKLKQRATNAAMSVMETFKAYGLRDSKEHFIDNDFLKTAPTEYVYPLDPGQYTDTWRINGMKFSDGDETKTYDVEIEVEEGEKGTFETVPFYDKNQDAIFTESEDASKFYDPYNLISYLFTAGNGFDPTDTKILKINVNRKIYIDITEDDSVSIRYEYEGTYTSHDDVGDHNGSFSLHFNGDDPEIKIDSVDIPIISSEEEAFDNLKQEKTSEDGDVLRDLYFYFFPSYSKKIGTTDVCEVDTKDHFYFNNKHSDDVKVYVFKQKDPSYTNEELTVKENGYYAEVHCYGINYKNTFLYDVVNSNLGNLQQRNMFSGITNEGSGAGSITINNSHETGEIPLTAKIKITIIDPNPKPNMEPELVEMKGTITW